MKTKLSKRILSAVLAVMMMVTSIPMFALTAAADNSSEAVTDAYTEAANAAMTAFADKLETPNAAFTNVTNAYNAYVTCQEALDAYSYGGVSVSVLTDATDKLKTATAAIGIFTGAADAVNAKDASEYVKVWDGDSTDGYSTLYKNVLWSETNYSAVRGTVSDDNTSCYTALYYPEVTFLYDGVNVPQATIRSTTNGTDKKANRKRWVYTVQMTNSDGISLDENWRGKDGGNRDVNWAWGIGTDRLSFTDVQNGASTYQVYQCGGTTIFNSVTKNEQNFSNIYKFTGTMADDKFYLDITPSITSYFGSDGTFKTTDITQNVTGNQAIHVVNYKALTDALARNGEKMKSIDLANYSQGGLSYYIAAMDAATSFNPLDWFTTSNNYAGCAGEISRLISVMDAADTSKTNDAAYANLRKAMDAKRGDYNNGTQPADSTDASWTELKGAYEAAKSIMASLLSTGYNDAAGAQAAADRLNAANLEFNTAKIDTTELEAVIDALFAYESIFVTETRTAATNAAAAAQIAVWGSVDNYPNTTDTISDTPENQAIYAQVLDELRAAIKGLRIDPADPTMTAKGRYSLVSAIALGDTVNLDEFSNRAVFDKAVSEANIYIGTLPNVEFTDYDAQLEEYKTYIESVINAFNSLKRPGDTFIGLPNGTVGQTGETKEMTTLNTKDTYNFNADFSYTPSAVIIKTSHDAVSVPYGIATAGISSDCTNTNTGIDSISINATAPQINGQGGANQIDTRYNNTSTPHALTDDQKATYAGCLTNGNFELKNIKYAGRSSNNVAGQAFTDQSGNRISVADAENYILDDIVGTTDGSSNNPTWGTVTVAPSSKSAAYAYISGDLTVNLPATEKPTLGVTTGISKNTYTLDGYFGVVGPFNTKNGALNFIHYVYMTSASTGEKINSTVTVVDISNLVDLVNECNKITDPGKYTAESWARFETALADAAGDTEDKNLTADQIETKYSGKYANLWSAYNALKLKDYQVLFKYMTADGVEKTLTLVPTHGEKLTKKLYLDKINAIDTPDYVDGNYTMEFIGWSPELDLEAEITGPVTYVAQYKPTLNLANFTAFNEAKANLVNALVDKKFTASSLEAAAAEVAKLAYFDEAAQAGVMADKQTEIDAETAVLQAQLAALKSVDYDKSVADAVSEQIAAAQKTDPDMYESNVSLHNEETVSICGKEVVGLVFETQAELDAAIADAVNAMSPIVYDIYLNGVKIGTGAYGESIIVSSTGAIYNNEADYDSDDRDGEDWAAWNYHYKSRTTESVDKYMFTAKSIGFIVRGDAYITSTPADSPDSNYLVTIKDANSDKALLAEITSGEYTLPKAPARPYYNFVKYVVDGVDYKAGDKITVTANTTVEAVYAAKEENTFEIIFYEGADNFDAGTSTKEVSNLKYDDVVAFEAENVYAWAFGKQDADYNNEYTVIAYGPTYSFNVYQSMADTDEYYGGLVALTLDDYNKLQEIDSEYARTNTLITPDGTAVEVVSGNYMDQNYVYSEGKPFVAAHNVPVPKYSDSNVEKFTLIGFTAYPEGYTVVEHGFLFTKDLNVNQMTVEDADGKHIVRMKSSVTTVGDQFVVDVRNPASTVNFKYSAYAIIKDAEGNTSYIYSNILDGSNNF